MKNTTVTSLELDNNIKIYVCIFAYSKESQYWYLQRIHTDTDQIKSPRLYIERHGVHVDVKSKNSNRPLTSTNELEEHFKIIYFPNIISNLIHVPECILVRMFVSATLQ